MREVGGLSFGFSSAIGSSGARILHRRSAKRFPRLETVLTPVQDAAFMLLRIATFTALGLALGACAVDDADRAGSARAGEYEPVGEIAQAMTVCPGDVVVHGIDVSYYQGDIDWPAVKAGGYDFAITRINHSDFMDPEFDGNWAAIKEVGMIRGAYQYFEPGDDVAYQAQIVIDKLGMLGPGDLPAVIDVETTSGLGPTAVANAVAEWVELVEAGTGKKPIIYTGKYFWEDNVGSAAFADYPLWHAAYPNACQPPNPPPPECGSCANIADQWSDWIVWQFSSSGDVPGIAGNVDLNVWKGDLASLQAFAGMGGVVTGNYGAALASVEAPETVLLGETFTVRATFTNTGESPWDSMTHIGTTEPRDRTSPFEAPSWISSTRPVAVTGGVNTGESYTFEFSMKAPAEPGTHVESFGLVQEAVAWFADQGGPADSVITLELQVIEGVPSGSGGGAGEGGAGGAGEGGAGDDDGGDEDCSCRSAPGAPRSGPSSALLIAGLAAAFTIARRRRALQAAEIYRQDAE